MRLKSISLTNFRNFASKSFDFKDELTVIIGKNARGKTSLLEAVYSIFTGTGFRESREVELIKFEKNESILSSVLTEEGGDLFLQIQIVKTDENRVSKKFFINKTHKSSQKFKAGSPHAVLFAPEHIQIITGSPSRKRRYFDDVLSKDDPVYKTKIRNYEEAFRKRNKILESYDNLSKLKEEILFWDNYLIEQAEYIVSKREMYVCFLNKNNRLNNKIFSIKYTSFPFNKIELDRFREREYLFRRTLIGPQKDEYKIFMDKENRKQEVDLYGSRSEQRMALFWLKRNELLYFEKKSGMKPILLLDDIFSELDDENRELVMDIIVGYQTVATTTEIDKFRESDIILLT